MWSDNKVRELIARKVLHTSLLNITVVAFKVLPLGSYANVNKHTEVSVHGKHTVASSRTLLSDLVGWGGMDWFHLAWDREQCWDLLNVVMIIHVP
jgi:hypothetical protein